MTDSDPSSSPSSDPSSSDPERGRTLSARQAAAILGIRVETLYAYVSRGLIRSEPGPSARERRYSKQDIEDLKQRRAQRRKPEKALETALHFGGPVLESSLTLIDEGRLYYRGRDVLELVDAWSFEENAAELWQEGGRGLADELFGADPVNGIAELPESVEALRRQVASLPAVVQFQILLPLLAHGDAMAFDTRPGGVARTGGRICRAMACIASKGKSWQGDDVCQGDGVWQGDVVSTLQHAWQCPGEAAAGLLRAALVLSLDHELNVSSFTARTTASAGANPYAAVLAGLAALQGPEHGGHTRRVEALFQEAGDASRVEEVLTQRLRRGEPLPGLGQTLYPGGDPRHRELLRRLQDALPDAPATAEAEALQAAGWKLMREHPTVDVALVSVARALHLPSDSAITLFALGRTVGWIGHAAEQYQQGQLIRPRARYVGNAPPVRIC